MYWWYLANRDIVSPVGTYEVLVNSGHVGALDSFLEPIHDALL